ncbi:MAG: 50S ribosomal protein L29 [Flavobacteriales bacterium]|nr:50S ribosomal protein L29 [Flavobacteriales bacterium]MCX7651193.1 50S ribosomal protein L29 [Flavobacteriales bacterium]MDW8432480.1 50S ribosomal protein L29 [Flavobacteriales bacterium]
MKKEDIKELSTQDLKDKVVDLKSELTGLRFNHKASPLDNPQKIRKTRRLIAAILTEIRQREMAPKSQA